MATPRQGISRREFARREQCDEKQVRLRIDSGHLTTYEDGTLDPDLVGTNWRKFTRPKTEVKPDALPDPDDVLSDVDLEDALDGLPIPKKALSEARRELYASLRQQLAYEREVGMVIPISVIETEVAKVYGAVRKKLSELPARVAVDLAAIKDASKCRSRIKDEIEVILEELHLDIDNLGPNDAEPA